MSLPNKEQWRSGWFTSLHTVLWPIWLSLLIPPLSPRLSHPLPQPVSSSDHTSDCQTVSDGCPLPWLTRHRGHSTVVLDHQQGEVLTCGTDVTDQHSYFQVDDVAYTVLNLNGQTPKPSTSASPSPTVTETVYSEVKKK